MVKAQNCHCANVTGIQIFEGVYLATYLPTYAIAINLTMQFETPLDWIPSLTSVVECSPLIVTPQTPLVDAIAMISQAHYPSCSLINSDISESQFDPLNSGSQVAQHEVRTSCVLVKQDQDLVGILTARDVVRLTAQEIDFQSATVGDFMTTPIVTMPQRSVGDIFAALFLFRRYQIRHLPLVDDQGELIGVVSHDGIQHILRPANLLRFRRVADVMTTQVIYASIDTSVLDLAYLMSEHRVSCVVITQIDGEGNQCPVGIVTERDIVQFHAFQINLATTQAQTVMSSPLFLLSPDDSLWTAHQEMKKRRVGRMVVSWNWGQNLGIVTQTSLLKIFDPMEMYGVIENMQKTIQQLQTESSESAETVAPIVNKQSKNLSKTVVSSVDRTDSVIARVYTTIHQLINNFDLSNEEMRSQLSAVLDDLQPLKSSSLTAIPEKESEKKFPPLQSSILF